MSTITHHARKLLKLLRAHPDMLDDEAHRDELRTLALILRDVLDEVNSARLLDVMIELGEDFREDELL